MAEAEEFKQAVEAFHNLSYEDTAKLKELNTRIQKHSAKWSVHKGGERNADGTIRMPWVQNDPLIYEFIDFMATKDLLPVFAWTEWDKGSELFTSEDPTKYDNIDIETALKLIYATTRKERFADGTLAWAFESGQFPKLVKRIVTLGAK
jgi:hypothetical protein